MILSTLAIAAIAVGQVEMAKGKISYVHPKVGEVTKVNFFGQYRGPKSEIASLIWEEQTRQTITPNRPIPAGTIIQTGKDGFLKLLLSEQTVIDVGPESTFSIRQPTVEHFWDIQIYTGVFRFIHPSSLNSPTLKIITPNTELRVSEAEFLVIAEIPIGLPTHDYAQTQVLSIHGQVKADILKQTNAGLVYVQPFVISPSFQFLAGGQMGVSQNIHLHAFSTSDVRRNLKELGPLVNVFATPIGMRPRFFDDFSWPENFQPNSLGPLIQPDLHDVTGTPPIDLIPLYFKRASSS